MPEENKCLQCNGLGKLTNILEPGHTICDACGGLGCFNVVIYPEPVEVPKTITMELQPMTKDLLDSMDAVDRTIALQKYQEWCKNQRALEKESVKKEFSWGDIERKKKQRIATAKWRMKNPDKIKKYTHANPEKRNKYGKEYYEKNKEIIARKQKIKYRLKKVKGGNE